MSTEQPLFGTIVEELDRACLARDKQAAAAAVARLVNAANPASRHDLTKIRALARSYAADIHGWEIDL